MTFRAFSVISAAGLVLGASTLAQAAVLPEHDPISIVVVSDEVNPNGLSPAELTQPGDISAAISRADSGINVANIDEVDSGCVDTATAALADGTVDVLVYFAHRAAMGCMGGSAQAEFDAAVAAHLERGGGVVVFHHGIYTAGGKEGILQLLGGTADQLAWDTGSGQNVIAVGGDHFVTTNEIEYDLMLAYESAGLGIAAADYPAFNNTPDERYPNTRPLTEAGESRTMLFASDYAADQMLGYDLHRPAWSGHVVFYQPGEYQPNALDDVDGNNFQILANAIYYVATTQEDPSDPTTTTGDTEGDTDTDGDATDGGTSDGTSDGGSSGGGDESTSTSSDASSGGSGTTAAQTTAVTTDTDAAGSEDDDASGCSCNANDTVPNGAMFGLLLGGLALGRRRRRSPARG